METPPTHKRHSPREWLQAKVKKSKGEIPWWWECDRRTCPWWNWSPQAEVLFHQTKREGMF